MATILDSTALDIDLVKTADRLIEVYSLIFPTKVPEGVFPFHPKPCPASSVRAREGAGCGSVGAVSGA